jgi:hypothetical protein
MRVTNIRRTNSHVKFRTNLLKIRRIIDYLIENGVDERIFESKRMELLENCYKEMEYMKI